MPTAHVNGVDLDYEVVGSGPRLVLCNGSGTTRASSRLLIDLFAPGCSLLAFDYRGLGASAPVSAPYAMADCAADVLGLLDAVGWATARVLGISFGGMVAQELAVTAPDRVERLALLCTSAGGDGGSSYPLHELESLGADARAEVATRLLDTRFDADWLADHPGDRALAEMLARRDADPAHEAGRHAQFEARRGHDVWDRLDVIGCPTLVAAGRFDGIAPLANSAAIASRIPGAELRVYDGGHVFFAQDPAALPDVRDFLFADRP